MTTKMIFAACLVLTLCTLGAEGLCYKDGCSAIHRHLLAAATGNKADMCRKYDDLSKCLITAGCEHDDAIYTAEFYCGGQCGSCSGEGGAERSCTKDTTNCTLKMLPLYQAVGKVEVAKLEAAATTVVEATKNVMCMKYYELYKCYRTVGCEHDEAVYDTKVFCKGQCGSCSEGAVGFCTKGSVDCSRKSSTLTEALITRTDLCKKYDDLYQCYITAGCKPYHATGSTRIDCLGQCGSCSGGGGAEGLCTNGPVDCSTKSTTLAAASITKTDMCTKYDDLYKCYITAGCELDDATRSTEIACEGQCGSCSGGGADGVCLKGVADCLTKGSALAAAAGNDLCTKYDDLYQCYITAGCAPDDATGYTKVYCPGGCGSCSGGGDAVKVSLAALIAAILLAYIYA